MMAKHCMSHVHCSPEKVKKEFLEHWRKNAWNDKEDWDDSVFLGAAEEGAFRVAPNTTSNDCRIGMVDQCYFCRREDGS